MKLPKFILTSMPDYEWAVETNGLGGEGSEGEGKVESGVVACVPL
jgi:hypothetical protein